MLWCQLVIIFQNFIFLLSSILWVIHFNNKKINHLDNQSFCCREVEKSVVGEKVSLAQAMLNLNKIMSLIINPKPQHKIGISASIRMHARRDTWIYIKLGSYTIVECVDVSTNKNLDSLKKNVNWIPTLLVQGSALFVIFTFADILASTVSGLNQNLATWIYELVHPSSSLPQYRFNSLPLP